MTTTRPGVLIKALPAYSGVTVLWIILLIWEFTQQVGFASSTNLQSIVQASAVPLVLAVGMTFAVLLGGIDLSVGALLGLSGIALGSLQGRVSELWAIALTILFAAAVAALVNSTLIGLFRLSPFIVTLGGLSLFRGLAFLFSDGETTTVSSPMILDFGFGSVFGISIPLLVMVAVLALGLVILRFTYFGRDVYAIGGNPEAAKISGIAVVRVTAVVYLICGVCVGIATILQTGRSGAASPTAGAGIELQVAAAVLLGGTSLSGGSGSLVGTAIAVLFLNTVDNALNLAGVESYWQQIITGALLILAVLLERVRTAGHGAMIASLRRLAPRLHSPTGSAA